MVTALVILGAVLVGGGVVAAAAYYLWSENLRARKEQETQFRAALVAELRKKGTSAVDFAKLVEENGVSPEVARETAANLYATCCQRALADDQITPAERRQLDALRHALALPNEIASAIEQRVKEARYQDAVQQALADGKITSEEAADLERLRSSLGLGQQRASALGGTSVRDAYLALFRRVISDGRLTPEDLRQLQDYRKAFGITRDEANEITRQDVLGLYRQWFYNIIQDGQVTPEEEQGLAWLKREFGLDSLDTQVYESQLQEVKMLAAYREGRLPSIKTRKLLEGGEICHWEGPCVYQWETATQTKEAQGDLVVTSEQLVFSSPIRSFSLSPSKILDIAIYSDALVIQSATNRGSGTYFVQQPRILEAILVGLVRRHKYQVSANYSSNLSRHIPDTVRREVWQRDGGRCVRCGAMDYLEFDHIIPHSKGGANTVANVQLLCRRCNNLKRDRI